MALDPTTNIGKLRLRVADYSDLPILPDAVYQAVLDGNSNSLTRSARTIASYILGILSHKTHRKLATLEVWGAEAFKNYKEFLLLTVSNPAFMDLSLSVYAAYNECSPILDFQRDWNRNFVEFTEGQQLAFNADLSPNDGTRTGGL